MGDERLREEQTDAEPEYSDVLIIGAGISGIGAAYRIHEKNPKLSYTGTRTACADRRHLGPHSVIRASGRTATSSR